LNCNSSIEAFCAGDDSKRARERDGGNKKCPLTWLMRKNALHKTGKISWLIKFLSLLLAGVVDLAGKNMAQRRRADFLCALYYCLYLALL